MMKMNKTLLVILSGILIACSHSNVVSEETKVIKDKKIKKSRPFVVPYCECLFSKQTNIYKAPLLLWEFYGSASFKKDKNYIELDNINENLGKNLGDSGYFQFSNQEVTLKGNCKVTKTCPKNSDKCSSVRYEGTIEMMEGNKKTIFPVWGRCGC